MTIYHKAREFLALCNILLFTEKVFIFLFVNLI